MRIINRRYFLTCMLMVVVTLVPGFVMATELTLTTGRSFPVRFISAEAKQSSSSEIAISGLIYRPRKMTMTGHVHVYRYAEGGHMISQSKHRIPRLNSRRGGSMRIPFLVSIKTVSEESGQIRLEYHKSCYSES